MEVGVPCLICKNPSPHHSLVEEKVNFVLRQVLQVPESSLSKKLLEGSWALCADCRQLVGECQAVHEELCNLQRKWNEVRADVFRKVKAIDSGGVKDDAPGCGQDVMRLETRRFVVNHGYAFCESVGMAEEQEAAVPLDADCAPGTTVQGMQIDVDENAVARAEEDIGPPVAGERGDEDPPSPVVVAATGVGGEIGTNSCKLVSCSGLTEEDAPGGGGDAFALNHVFVSSGFIGWRQVAEEESIEEEAADERDDDSGIRELRVASTPHTTECLFCPIKVNRNSHLIAHMRVHTRERPFWCGVCDREFTHKGNLKSHQRIHTGEKPAPRQSLECLFCRKKLRKNGHLEVHMRVHTRERPFWCGVCGKEFAHECSLNKHQQTHSEEKLHQCELCRKRFSHSSNLNRHVRAHLGEKPWKCPDCGKAFVGKQELTVHRVVHTGERPYQCDLCPWRFTQSSSLLSHKKKMHRSF